MVPGYLPSQLPDLHPPQLHNFFTNMGIVHPLSLFVCYAYGPAELDVAVMGSYRFMNRDQYITLVAKRRGLSVMPPAAHQ